MVVQAVRTAEQGSYRHQWEDHYLKGHGNHILLLVGQVVDHEMAPPIHQQHFARGDVVRPIDQRYSRMLRSDFCQQAEQQALAVV